LTKNGAADALALRTRSLVVAATWCFLVRSAAVALWIIDTAISIVTAEAAMLLVILFMVVSPGLSSARQDCLVESEAIHDRVRR
jgi:hypothetical protein